MGIKSNFNKFLREKCPEEFELIHISEYCYKKIAIDVSLYMCKFKAVCGDRWLSSFINLIACLRKNEVHCVFIFDGQAPKEKDLERENRHAAKEKLEEKVFDLKSSMEIFHQTGEMNEILTTFYEKHNEDIPSFIGGSKKINVKWLENKINQKINQVIDISPEDLENVKKLFKILKVPYVMAPCEAEKMCSKLCRDGTVDAVLSEDTDVMAYGCPIFLSKIDTNEETCIRINYDRLIKNLELKQEEFLDLCIMCGTDYNKNIPKVGSATAYKKIIEFKSIPNIKNLDVSILNHERVRFLFNNFDEITPVKIPFCEKPDFTELENFMKENNINNRIDSLMKCFCDANILFE
jgi:flap endonuclease-1